MCEQCARGYATETCKTKCPGYDGKNRRAPVPGLDSATWAKTERASAYVVVREGHGPRQKRVVYCHSIAMSTPPTAVQRTTFARCGVWRRRVRNIRDASGIVVVCPREVVVNAPSHRHLCCPLKPPTLWANTVNSPRSYGLRSRLISSWTLRTGPMGRCRMPTVRSSAVISPASTVLPRIIFRSTTRIRIRWPAEDCRGHVPS